ncbi:tetratricopeptide (TPR) repeat protein [Flavobacterium arsenatis]|uniref:Tetratricopeptide (TPR) repeat protein n=1 Tax=Flavobacterium arsenatis TaxID=1484332 RepID=A0ABU1TSD7_9FLAO|nr:tetratricopeptide repeat protein [Flavobacterium arsenatis]MDR6968790.1 tetratricopeptide (TPR) repeat protein [Flavobacterium arsenatis]
MKKLLVIIGILFSLNVFACLNGETKVLTNGLALYEDYEGIIPRGHEFFTIEFDKVFKQLDSLYNKTKKIEYLSDKGYVLVIQGKYQEALNLYLDIEKTHPNRYSTASNLGTIYELLGDNTNALKWIKKSVAISPDSHNGSEWLHIKILEAKINPNTISSEFFTKTSFGNFDMPVSELSANQTEKLIKSIYYQLNERMSFIKSEDSIIGLLLFELGNLAMLESNFKDANEIFKIAKDYGYESSLLEKRISFTNGFLFAKAINYTTPNNYIEVINYEKTALLILSILIALIGLYFLIKKLKA